jgi:hypothetical protein
MPPYAKSPRFLGGSLLATIVTLMHPALATAAGKFAAPVQNTFTLSFDDPAALTPGLTNIKISAGFDSFRDWDDSNAGEVATWGSFGGAPDEVLVGVLADLGPNGVGDHAAVMQIPSKTGGSYFSNLSWQVKGLVLGNSSGGTVFDSISGMDIPVPDMDSGIALTVPVKTNVPDAGFRINFDTGASGSNQNVDDIDGNGTPGSFVIGNVPGLIDNNAPGSRVILFGPTGIGSLPVDTWSTSLGVGVNENPSSVNGWTNASFSPFNGRGPRSFDLTRVGVTFPGGGQIGELLVGSFTMSGPDVLKYHPADFNYDEMVDDADIDMLFAAIAADALNDSLEPVPDLDENNRPDFLPVFGVNQVPGVKVALAEKFSLTTTDNSVLDFADVDELVLNILGTSYGDLNLDGVKDAADRATLVANLGLAGGWAAGDLNGDGVVDGADLSIFDGPGSPGDFNDDGAIDGADFLVWQRDFGGALGVSDLADWEAGFGGGVANLGAVPEPLSATLLIAIGTTLAANRRRKKGI